MSVRQHVGKDPAVTDQFLVGDAGQDRDREFDFGERIEQFFVLDQRDTTVIQVLSLIDARRIDATIDTDHQIERQSVLITQLRERPEHATGQRVTV